MFLCALVLLPSLISCEGHSSDNGGDKDVSPAMCMVRYENDGTKEYFNVAVRDEYKHDIWYVFKVNHYRDHSSLNYMDLWRIDWAYKGKYDTVSGNMENILDRILTNGESESVIKDYGENFNMPDHIDTYDFTGGFHGDERIDLEEGDGVGFYMDGVLLNADRLSGFSGWVECGEFSYLQRSTMYKTALKVDGNPVESDHHPVASHIKKTTFVKSGYVTENTIVMRDEIDFYWYSGICCVGTSVAERGCNESMKSVVFDQSGPNRLEGIGNCEYFAWSDSNEIEVHVKANMTDENIDTQCRMFIWDTVNYAKFYRRYPANGALRSKLGDEFSARMEVSFSTR